jgi:hypothetical protein
MRSDLPPRTVYIVADSRDPARNTYDGVVDLAANNSWGPFAYALVKQTYRVTPQGECERVEPEPLFHDMRDPDVEPRLKAGSDFWPIKYATDVVVEGAAFPPQGEIVDRMTVTVSVGQAEKRVAVFGRRLLRWNDRGTPSITRPEPINEPVPLTWENAYGGVDFRVTDPSVEGLSEEAAAFALEHDHPGLYPRNPFGKGYLVLQEPTAGDVELPQLEDPNDLLAPDRMITGNPREWYKQPLPWSFAWMHPMMFPRFVHFAGGPEAWYPGPEDERMPEVRRGFLQSGYRSEMEKRSLDEGPDPRFRQGASHGMILHDVPDRAPVRIEGMHPEGKTLRFRLPPSPDVELQVENRRERVQPRLHSLVCRPAEEMFYVLYGAALKMPRPLVPGIHKHIPVAAYVNGKAPIVYDAPVPVREQLAAATKQEEQNK